MATVSALIATTVAALTVLGTVAAVQAQDVWVAGERALPVGLRMLGTLALIAAGLAPWAIRSAHPVAAVGLALASISSQLPLWSGWSWLPGPARNAVLALGYLAVVGLAQVALRWPSRDHSLALPLAWGLTGAAVLLRLLAYDSGADPDCIRMCRQVSVPLDGVATAHLLLAACAALTVTAAAAAEVPILVGRGGIPRTIRWTVAGAMGVLAGLLVASVIGTIDRAWPGGSILLATLPVAAVAGAVGWIELRQRRTRAAVESLIGGLTSLGSTGPGPAVTRPVAFALPEGGWVDAHGRPVADDPPGRWLVLDDSSGPAVRLEQPARVELDEALLQLTPGVRLALANARLTAEARAHVHELERAQREAVSRADTERRRIERDLHDGAQQQLVSAAFHLGVARVRPGGHDPDRLAGYADQIRSALDRLRRITHGMFPEVLVSDGLEAALTDLVHDAPIRAHLEFRGDLTVRPDVGRAAYAVVAASLHQDAAVSQSRTSDQTPAQVTAARDADLLTVTIRTFTGDPRTADHSPVADRVGSLGGHFEVHPRPGGTLVRVVIPCAS